MPREGRDTLMQAQTTVAKARFDHTDTVMVELPEWLRSELSDKFDHCPQEIPGVVVSDIADAEGENHVPVWIMPPGAPENDITVYGFAPDRLTHDSMM